MIELGVIIAILVGLGQVAKQLGLPAKYIPLMNLVLGIALGLVGGLGGDVTILEGVIAGAIVGLSASGLFDQSKIITKK